MPHGESLTPLSFLHRAADAFGDRIAVVDGSTTLTYRELDERVGLLAGGLQRMGVASGDRAAVLAPNTHVALEATLGIPAAGMVLVALNTRLSPPELATILRHSGVRVLIYDDEFEDVVRATLTRLDDPVETVRAGGSEDQYESLLSGRRYIASIGDEWQLFSLNYTSGTTGKPKGVMYHHRGVYLQALSMVAHARLGPDTVYLWTLPMFHCNGWCFPWAVTAAGGTHVCQRKVDSSDSWRLIRAHGVTHLCAAPTVLNALVHDPAAGDAPLAVVPVKVATGGAPPSPALLERAARANLDVQHLYGMTETFGPSVICDWWPEWDRLPSASAIRLKAMQGTRTIVTSGLRVVHGSGEEVTMDGETIGELQLRGNNIMLGYFMDAETTQTAFDGDWLRTGDLAVRHPNGYVEVRDRAKDVIITGGENVTSVEVEQALGNHAAVFECAVVGIPDDHWGERVVAFVVAQPDHEVTTDELREHVRGQLAGFKVPKDVILVDALPKTSTGKIQKFQLREMSP